MTNQITSTSISTHALQQLRETHADFILLDVREPEEYADCNLGGLLIPLSELPMRVSELDKNKRIVVHCKVDGRSQYAAAFLQQEGFTQVSYLKGGILAWIKEIGFLPHHPAT